MLVQWRHSESSSDVCLIFIAARLVLLKLESGTSHEHEREHKRERERERHAIGKITLWYLDILGRFLCSLQFQNKDCFAPRQTTIISTSLHAGMELTLANVEHYGCCWPHRMDTLGEHVVI